MLQLVVNAVLGATIATAITLVSRGPYPYLAGLLPLFPAFAFYAHLRAFGSGGIESVKSVAAFGLISLFAYAAYLFCLYCLLDNHVSFSVAVIGAIVLWILTAGILIGAWNVFGLEARLLAT